VWTAISDGRRKLAGVSCSSREGLLKPVFVADCLEAPFQGGQIGHRQGRKSPAQKFFDADRTAITESLPRLDAGKSSKTDCFARRRVVIH